MSLDLGRCCQGGSRGTVPQVPVCAMYSHWPTPRPVFPPASAVSQAVRRGWAWWESLFHHSSLGRDKQWSCHCTLPPSSLTVDCPHPSCWRDCRPGAGCRVVSQEGWLVGLGAAASWQGEPTHARANTAGQAEPVGRGISGVGGPGREWVQPPDSRGGLPATGPIHDSGLLQP